MQNHRAGHAFILRKKSENKIERATWNYENIADGNRHTTSILTMLPQLLEGFLLKIFSEVFTVSTLITLPQVLGPFLRDPNSEPFDASKLVNCVSLSSEHVSLESSVVSSLRSWPFSSTSSSITTGTRFGDLGRKPQMNVCAVTSSYNNQGGKCFQPISSIVYIVNCLF